MHGHIITCLYHNYVYNIIYGLCLLALYRLRQNWMKLLKVLLMQVYWRCYRNTLTSFALYLCIVRTLLLQVRLIC